MTEFQKARETARQRGLERIRQLVEHDSPTDEILQMVQDYAMAFAREYHGCNK